MDISVLKYNLLDSFEKKEVSDFIDFLLSKKKKAQKVETTSYKQKILSVSTWSDEDVKIFKENAKNFNQWPPITW